MGRYKCTVPANAWHTPFHLHSSRLLLFVTCACDCYPPRTRTLPRRQDRAREGLFFSPSLELATQWIVIKKEVQPECRSPSHQTGSPWTAFHLPRYEKGEVWLNDPSCGRESGLMWLWLCLSWVVLAIGIELICGRWRGNEWFDSHHARSFVTIVILL